MKIINKYENQLIEIDKIIENQYPSDSEDVYVFLEVQKKLIKETIELFKGFELMAGIVHVEAETELIVSKELTFKLSEISNEDLHNICKEEKEKIIKEENENNKKHI